jgi:alpha-tubulin suppressor-like RCC1 family protein
VNSKLICITENFLLKNTEIFVKIAAGLNHCVALTSFSRVFVWGDGRRNQIGRKLMEHRLDNGLKPEPLRIRKAKDIYCGYYNTFIITFDDKVFACGYNSHLQTGIIQQKRKLEDNIVQLLTEVQLPPGKIIQIAAHYTHTLILYQDGSVYILGGISQSKWNDNTDMIKKPCWNTEDYKPLLLNLNDIIKVSANNRYNLALNSRGEIFYWSGRGGTVKQLNITSQKGRIIDLEQNQDYIIFLIK